MPRVRISNKCRKCRGARDCSTLDEDHFSCKCGIDLRKKVTKKNDLRDFLRRRCCTEGAVKALLKKSRSIFVDPSLIVNYLLPECETCAFTKIGEEGWKRSRGFCNYQCCPELNSPCMESLRQIVRANPNRLSIDQACDLEDIITSFPRSDEDCAEPTFTGRVDVYPDMIYSSDPLKLEPQELPVFNVDFTENGEVVCNIDPGTVVVTSTTGDDERAIDSTEGYDIAEPAAASTEANNLLGDLISATFKEDTEDKEEIAGQAELLDELISIFTEDQSPHNVE